MFVNHTPFPAIAFDSLNVKRRLHTTTVLRARFRFHQTDTKDLWTLRLDPNQGGLEAEDLYYDDDLSQPVQRESDYAPYKSATDIILNGTAYSADNPLQQHWHCGILVENDQKEILLEKSLRVCGERTWQKKEGEWQLSEPAPIDQVSLNPRNAFGGKKHTPDTPDNQEIELSNYYAANPHGKGWYSDHLPEPYHAPQIMHPSETLDSPETEYPPAHFSWVPRLSPLRHKKAGTMDEQWLQNESPFLPDDFDEDYYLGTAPDQQIRPHLKGNEIITLSHLLPRYPQQRIQLPDYLLLYRYLFAEQEAILGRMDLDTVLFAFDDPDPKAWRVELTWRSRTPAATGNSAHEVMLRVPDEHRAKPEPQNIPNKEFTHGR